MASSSAALTAKHIAPAGEANATALFYYQMRLIRLVEQKLLDLFSQGLVAGTVHTSIGQEACAVGVVNALDRERDVIFSTHRAHGHFLAYSDEVEGLVAEILGRKTGVCGGVGGTQHLHIGNLYTNGIQGGIVPAAVGAALAEKLRRTGAISTVFLGDGTMGQGTVYEGLNIASLWSLPVLFVLEDNGYAQTTPKALQHAGDIAARAEPFRIGSAVADADDVLVVYRAAQSAVARVRDEGRPFFLALNTYRFAPHSKGDDTRSPREIAALRQHDALERLAEQLPADVKAEIDGTVEKRVARAVADALQAPFPSAREFGDQVGCPLG